MYMPCCATQSGLAHWLIGVQRSLHGSQLCLPASCVCVCVCSFLLCLVSLRYNMQTSFVRMRARLSNHDVLLLPSVLLVLAQRAACSEHEHNQSNHTKKSTNPLVVCLDYILLYDIILCSSTIIGSTGIYICIIIITTGIRVGTRWGAWNVQEGAPVPLRKTRGRPCRGAYDYHGDSFY